MMEIDLETRHFAKIIWDYHHLNQPLRKSDCILVLGSHDKKAVVDRAVQLYKANYAPVVIFSGGIGRLTKGIFEKPEAEVYAHIAMEKGMPKKDILIENKSTNTGENIQFTKKMLIEKGLNFETFIVVQKPYMERRVFATFKKVWPEKEFVVTSPQVSYEEYINGEFTEEDVINIIVGDLQRIAEYPKKGFQIEQDVPEEVMVAYNKLIKLGFDKQLIKE